jgi:hypothetical protein
MCCTDQTEALHSFAELGLHNTENLLPQVLPLSFEFLPQIDYIFGIHLAFAMADAWDPNQMVEVVG